MKKRIAVSTVAIFTVALVAYAAVIFDPATGTGFVGKGDVQLVYGWNNKQLQDNAGSVQFQFNSVSETTWTCSRTMPQEQTRERHRTTTTQGLIDEIARDNSKGKNGSITGFNLLGFDGDPTITTEGHALGTCGGGGFTYDVGSEETTIIGGGLEVSSDGGATWSPLQ